MIVTMKRVSIIFRAGKAGETLRTLRKLGILHLKTLDKSANKSSHDKLNEKIIILEKALTLIEQENRSGSLTESKNKNSNDTKLADNHFELARQLVKLSAKITKQEKELKNLALELHELEFWGEFNPDELISLRKKGVNLAVYQANDKQLENLPDKIFVTSLFCKDELDYLAIINPENLDLKLKEVEIPKRSLTTITGLIQTKENTLKELINKKLDLITKVSFFEQGLIAEKNKLNFEFARSCIEADKSIAYIQGYCPVEQITKLEEKAEREHWALLIESPEDDEAVPTLVKNSGLSKLFQPVMDFIGLVPGYKEFEPNHLFLFFFSCFYAMLVGDAGYGLIMLGTTLLAGKLIKDVKADVILLFYLLSGATIVWGAVTGLWFGIESSDKIPILKSLIIPEIYGFSKQSDNLVIRLCFTLGLIQLVVAHFWIAFKRFPALNFISEIGWIIFLVAVYLVAGTLVLSDPLHPLLLQMVVLSLALVILFEEQKNDGFLKGLVRGIIQFPINILKAIGNFSDLVSYIRLFAVGMATKEIAVAFNNLALDLGYESLTAGIGASIILFLGHLVNIVLAAVAVMVHGIRLNFLEFSNHLNMEWTGFAYQPFKKIES